jgi:type IV pilus secretin PilQ/predicted competence protein
MLAFLAMAPAVTAQTTPDLPRRAPSEPPVSVRGFQLNPSPPGPGAGDHFSQSTLEVRPPLAGTPGQKIILDVLDLKNIDIMDVLKLISQKSGVNIIASQNVTGRVTVFLRDIEVKDALKIIVDAYGWAYLEDSGIIKIMTAADYEVRYGVPFGHTMETAIRQLLYASTADIMTVLSQVKSPYGKVIPDEKSGTVILVDSPDKIDEMNVIIKKLDVPVETRVFQLSYAKAEQIAGKVAESVTPYVGSIKFDERSNRLVVEDSPKKLRHIEDVIAAFDHKDREVLIEARIVQINLSNAYKLGVDWQGIVSDFQELTFKSNFDILQATDKRGSLSVGTVGTDNDYWALVQALETAGTTDILSSPRIMTVNNKEARILVGSTEPYVTSTTTTPSSGPTTTSESVNFIEVGVKLFVTPTIHEDDFITMKIKPEVSSVRDTLVTGSNNSVPIVETSEAETTITVKDGVTIVIGGLIREEQRRTKRKVPFLGDLPYLGVAFRSESEEANKNEIAIFVTPTIVTGEAPASPDAGRYL